jgi:hypothetical protein
LSNALRYVRSLWSAEPLAAALRVDRPRFEAALVKLEPSLIDDPPFAGGVAIERGVPRAVPPRAGRKIAVDAALERCSDAVALGRTNVPVELSARTLTPVLAPGTLERAVAVAARALAGPVTLEAAGRRLEMTPTELGELLHSKLRGQELELELDAERLETWLSEKRPSLEAPARDAGFEVSAQDQPRVVPGEAGRLRPPSITPSCRSRASLRRRAPPSKPRSSASSSWSALSPLATRAVSRGSRTSIASPRCWTGWW